MLSLSIVIPIYKSEHSLKELMQAVSYNAQKITPDHEIILVDDSSPDNSWRIIQESASQNKKIKGIQLSRNFGQHPAIMAGLENSTGEWVIVMDADFQDDPGQIPELLNEASKGFDLVFARRIQRTDKITKRIWNLFFYKLFSYLTDSKFDGSIGNFGIYHRKVIASILSMKEPFKVFSLMARWVGFKHSSIDVLHGVRKGGKSSYTLSKLLNLALTIILTYSQKPLLLTVRFGLTIALMSVLFVCFNIVAYLTGIIQVVGYTSLIASIWFLGGLIIFFIGILGLYIGKIFEGVKNRPHYILTQKLNF